MYFWRIVPAARSDDTRWEDHPIFSEVLVRAETASLARLTAGRVLYKGDAKTQFGEEHDPIFVSAFADEKLYRVSEVDSDPRFTREGAREVLHSSELSSGVRTP